MSKPRVLFYAQDGRGLGHLRRIARVARALEQDASCMVVSGHREAAWLVSELCEFIHLPSLDLILPDRAAKRNWPPFMPGTCRAAREFRRRLLESAIAVFSPDAILVDHDPAGIGQELLRVIRTSPAKKMFLMRGVMDNPKRHEADIVDHAGRFLLKTFYHSIFVSCDRRICDVGHEYGFVPEVSAKMEYVGYISDPIDDAQIDRCREERGAGNGKPWVVCSAGGGAFGEALTAESLRIAKEMNGALFDIVAGPRSGLTIESEVTDQSGPPGSVRVHAEARALPLWHAAADIVICPGGYNSIVEVMEGYADLICVPTQPKGADEEQLIHANRLAQITPVRIVRNITDLANELCLALAAAHSRNASRARRALDLSGTTRIRDAVLDIFGLSPHLASSSTPAAVGGAVTP